MNEALYHINRIVQKSPEMNQSDKNDVLFLLYRQIHYLFTHLKKFENFPSVRSVFKYHLSKAK